LTPQGEQTRVRYAYDAFNRLTRVTVDLSPEDDSVADGNVYVTTYAYDDASGRLASIVQGDGTTVAFTYVQSGGEWRGATITGGRGGVTRSPASTAGQTVTAPLDGTALATTDTITTTTDYALNAAALSTTKTVTTTVTVPPYYTVQAGDTWASIAQALYGT